MTTATATRERPILFSGEMVRAILDGRKTQTRRVMKLQPSIEPQMRTDPKWGIVACWPGESEFDGWECHCPYGVPGDQLYVREPFVLHTDRMGRYAADAEHFVVPPEGHDWYMHRVAKGLVTWSWRHLPKWGCRLRLEITDVRVERVQDISADDVVAEGVEPKDVAGIGSDSSFVMHFSARWDRIYGKTHPWASNPWCWCISFRRLAASA